MQGCVPALATVRTAVRRSSRIWLGAAPGMHTPYCCCGRTPVQKSLVASRFASTSCCTLLARAAPLRNLFASELTTLLAPHPELMPKSSAEVTAVIFWPARDSVLAVRNARSLLLALITDLTDTVSPLLTKPVVMLSPARTAKLTAASFVSLMMSWLTSST